MSTLKNTEHDSIKKSQDPVAGFILSKADNKTRSIIVSTLPALLEYEAEGFKTERLYLESGVQPANNDWNKKIRDSVDSLLEQAGYSEDSSVRHQLSLMNFDTTDSHSVPPWTDADIEKMHKLASALDDPDEAPVQACTQCMRIGYKDVTPEMIEAAESIEDLYKRGTPNTWKAVFLAMLAARKQS